MLSFVKISVSQDFALFLKYPVSSFATGNVNSRARQPHVQQEHTADNGSPDHWESSSYNKSHSTPDFFLCWPCFAINFFHVPISSFSEVEQGRSACTSYFPWLWQKDNLRGQLHCRRFEGTVHHNWADVVTLMAAGVHGWSASYLGGRESRKRLCWPLPGFLLFFFFWFSWPQLIERCVYVRGESPLLVIFSRRTFTATP